MSNTGQQFRVNTDSTTSSGLGISYDTVDSNITFGYGYPRIQLRQYTLGEHMDLCNNGIDICGNNARVILTSDGLDICGTTHVSLAALSTLEGLSGKISDNFVDVIGQQQIAGTKTFTEEIQGSIESVRDGVYTRAENQDISGTKTFTEGLKCRDISLTDLDVIVGESVSYAANVSFVTDYVDSVINDINELKPATSEKIGGVILPSGENIDDISINETGVLSLPNVFFKDITNKSEVSSQTISGETFFTDPIRGDICGNAGSVTDGVYLSDNQEITGSKLFSNTLRKNAELNVILVNPVEIDISSNHYHDTENPDNSYNLFKINGHEQPVLEFTYGNKYRFIQDISFSLATPLQFYVDPQLTEEYYYTTISTRDISVATPPTHVTIDIDLSTAYDGDIPAYLYYDCSENNTRTAGNKIIIKGAPGIVDTLTTQTIIGDKTFGGNVNFTGMTISTNNVSFLGGTNINATDSSFNLEENNVYVTTQTPDNSSNLAASTGFVKTNIELLKDAVGTNLDTLKELADAIGNDADFFRTIDNSFQTIIGTNPEWTVSDPSTITLLSAAIYNDNDFGLNIDASINTKVSLTGDELISGEKTFSTGIDISNLKIINPDTEFKPASAGRVLMYHSNGTIDLCANTIITPHERIEFTGVSNEAVRTSGVQTIDGVKIFTETIDGDISGALRAPTTIMGGHLIPDTHEQYDIGSAGNKIRHIFISDNSLWIGEDHKINISEGKVRFKKRDVDKPPPTLKTYDNDIESSILTYTGKALIADISASGWLEYARSLPNLTINNNTGKEIELSDLYGNTEQDAWEDDDQTLTKTDKDAFIDVSNNAIRITNIDQTIEGNKSFSGTVDISNLKISDFSAKRNHVLMINDNYELDISADVNSAFLLDSNGVGTTHHVGIGSESDATAMLFVNGTASITDISTDTINIVGIATADGCPAGATDNTTNIATTQFVQNVSGGIYANIAVMSGFIDLSFGQAKDRTDVSFGKVDVSFVKVDASFVKVATTFSQLNTDIATRSGAVDVSFVKVDASFVKVDASFDVIATTFSQLNGDIATRSGAVDVSFVKVDASFVKVDASFDIVDASLEEMVTTQNKDQTIEGKKTFLDGLTVNPDSNNPIVFDNPAGHLKVNFKCQDNASKYTKLILGHEAATTGWLHLGSDTQRGAGIIYNQTVATPFETGKFIFYTQGGDGSIFKHMQFDNEVDNSNVEFFGDVSLNDPNGKFLGDLEGNADTASLAAQATKLAATQNIAGQPFDGTLAISIDLNDLSNVNTTSPPTDGQALIWDNTQWIAGNPTEAMYANLATQATQLTTAHNIAGQPFDGTQNVVIELDDLSGVDISMNILTNGQALVWNDSSGVWNPGNVAAAGGGGGGGGGIWSLESNNIQLPNSITKVQMHDQEFVFSGSQRLLIDQRTDTSYSDVLIPASSAVWTIADDSMKLPTDISVVHINDVNFKMTGTAARFTIDLTDTPEYTVGPSQSIGWDVSGGHIIYNGEGNIGIGTNDPQSALDVSGAITISENGKLAFDDTQVQKTWFGPDERGGEDISGGGWTMLKNLPPNSSHGFNEHSSDGTFTQDEGTESLSSVFGRPFSNDLAFPPDELLFTTLLNNGDRIWWILDYNKLTNISTGNGWSTSANGTAAPTGYLAGTFVKEQSTNSGSANWLMVSGTSGTFFDKSLYINNGSINPLNSNGERYVTSGYGEQYVLYFSGIAPGGPNTLGYNGEFLLNQGMSIFARDSTNIPANPVPYPTIIKKEADHLHISAPLSIYPEGDYELTQLLGFDGEIDLTVDSIAGNPLTSGDTIDNLGGWHLARRYKNFPALENFSDRFDFTFSYGTPMTEPAGNGTLFCRNVSNYDYDEILFYSDAHDVWQIWDRTSLENVKNMSLGGALVNGVKKSSVSENPHPVAVINAVGSMSRPHIYYSSADGSRDATFIANLNHAWTNYYDSTHPQINTAVSYYVRRSDGQPVRLKNKVQIDVDGNLDVDGTITCSRITASKTDSGAVGLTVTSAGYVGIGTTTPAVPLHVDKYAPNSLLGSGWHWFQASHDLFWHPTNSGSTSNISIRASQAIWSENSFVVSSDSRIKSDISDIDDDRALQQVNALESKEYHYIDPHRRREMKTIGFIAQEVKEIIPNAVSLQKDWVPDEMRILSSLEWDSNVLTIADLDMSSENLTGRFKFFVSNDPSGNDEIKVEIECEKDLSGNKTNQFKFEQQYTNVFFYGKEVNDFHTIDKAQIFALHHSAIQELSRRNDTLVAENTTKTAEIAMLTADNVQLKADISLIKQHLGI